MVRFSVAREAAFVASQRLRAKIYVILLQNGEYTFMTKPFIIPRDIIVDTVGLSYPDLRRA